MNILILKHDSLAKGIKEVQHNYLKHAKLQFDPDEDQVIKKSETVGDEDTFQDYCERDEKFALKTLLKI